MKKTQLIAIMLVLTLVDCYSQTSKQNQIIENPKQVENCNINKFDFEERRKAIKIVDEIINDPETSLSNIPSLSPKITILNEEGFQELLKQVTSEIYEERKTTHVQSIGKTGYILSALLAKLLSAYSFDNYKVDCIKKSYNNIYDKANLNLVLKYINSTISKNELMNDLQNERRV